jgi:hypothetical protein
MIEDEDLSSIKIQNEVSMRDYSGLGAKSLVPSLVRRRFMHLAELRPRRHSACLTMH